MSDADQIAGVNKMEQRLLDQIRRASEQGLVRGRAGSAPTVETGTSTLSDDVTVEPVEVQNKPAGNVTAPASISVTTSIDRDLSQIADVLAQVGPDAHCISSETVALNEWGDDQPFGAQIAKWRAGLVGEFDQPNPNAIVGLTRAYLHFGFGAEAARTVSLLPKDHPDREILTTLAALLDAGGSIGENAFSKQETCDSDTAMWSVISEPESARSANNQAVLRAFSRLPTHLRPHVGPRLSRIFSDAGNADMAESILRPVERTSDEAGPEIAMAQAATAELRGDHETAAQQRQTVAETGSEQAPLALIELVEQAFRNGTTLTPDTPDLTASYASEFKRSSLGPDLRRTDALAWAITGDFPRAFDRLSDIRSLDGDDAFDAARHPVLALMPERADDMTFLQFGLLQLQSFDRQIPEGIGNPMARRFLELGFAQAAVQVLTGTDLEAASPERRLLRAEAALAEGLPHQALVSLLGLDGKTAANLRAEAFLQTQNFQGAAHMLAQANQPDAANRSLWLASEWQSVPSDSDGPYGQIAQMSRSLVELGTAAADAPPLAQAKALIDESQTARSDISVLLQQLSLADRPD
ncbi:hypothetical protein ACXYMO_13175 [Arenibacterium sp. CAU 1754]